jgi:UDP-glucose 4-epimerase
MVVHGDGSQSRTFIHISDAVDALMGLMAEPSALGQVFNVGGTQEVTIKELALMVKEMTGSESDIDYISYDKAYGPGFEDMIRRCPDISKIRELIGFQPKVGLRRIIQSVVDYYTE